MMLEDIRAVYSEYTAQVARLESERRSWEGLFGIGKRLADDPCHDRFYDELKKLLDIYAGEKHSSEELRSVLEFIYSMPCDEGLPDGVLMPMNAVHSLTVGLAGQLAPKDAALLLEQYTEDFPKCRRFPVHKAVIRALEQAQNS